MLGAIIGDIAGSRFEFRNIKDKNFELFNDYCDYTDDSVLTFAVAKTLLDVGRGRSAGEIFDTAVKNLLFYGRKYPAPMGNYGGGFKRWLKSEIQKPYNSCGNGAGMRISPVGFFAKTEEELKIYSRAITETTHNHPQGVKGAEAVAMSVFLAKNGATKDEIKNRIAKDYYPELTTEKCSYEYLQRNYSWYYNGNGGLAQNSTPQAIACFLFSENFEDAIKTAISIGGDSDTIAAMTGGIAQAYYGINADLLSRATWFLPKEFQAILIEFTQKYMRPEK